MAKYKKKPVVIEAIEWNTFNRHSDENWPNWLQKANQDGVFYLSENHEFTIKTLEGNMIVNNGDYIIRGIKGELYPCKPDIFEMTYEKYGEDMGGKR